MSEDRKRHPSGRPLHGHHRRPLSIIRDPGRGPLISRLRQPEPKDAIGFHVMASSDDGDEGGL